MGLRSAVHLVMGKNLNYFIKKNIGEKTHCVTNSMAFTGLRFFFGISWKPKIKFISKYVFQLDAPCFNVHLLPEKEKKVIYLDKNNTIKLVYKKSQLLK